MPDSTVLAFPQIAVPLLQDVLALPNWQVDTVKVQKIRANNARLLNIRAAIAIQPFEEGTYELPPLFVQRIHTDGTVDTIQFNRQTIQVFTMPIDTATYVPHDLRGQIKYPVTFAEVMPWLMGFWALALLVIGIVAWIVSRRRNAEGPAFQEPAHITALRKLDKYRGDKFWAPDKQKQFYTGVTDALREYIARGPVRGDEGSLRTGGLREVREVHRHARGQCDRAPAGRPFRHFHLPNGDRRGRDCRSSRQ